MQPQLNLSSKIRAIHKEKATNREMLDAVTFAESKSGLGLTLFPAQKFILKVFYTLPLSDTLDIPIVIKDMFNENVVSTFYSEIEFFKYLSAQKKINLTYETYLKKLEEGSVINEAVLICGRRASKTVLTSVIVCHTLYLLLSLHDPFEYYSIIKQDPIGIALISNSSKSSSRTFEMISQFILGSRFFSSFIAGFTDDGLYLKTESFKQEEVDGIPHSRKGDILISSYSANASVRGAANKVFVIDEIAHFIDANSIHKTVFLDELTYEAIQPSIYGFVNPETGKSDGLGFIMSSPNGKKGLLWDFYNKSFERDNIMMINVPSNWINNNIAPDALKGTYAKSEHSFRQEVMAEFIDQESNWITDINKLYACFNHNNLNECKQRDSYVRFAGFDLALSNDNTVLAIGHYQDTRPNDLLFDKPEYEYLIANDTNGFYVIDYVHVWQPTDSGDIQIEQIIYDLDNIFRRWKIKTGSYDQFSHAIFTQMILKKPSIRMEMKPATQAFNSEKAMLTKRLINEGRLIMPNLDIVRKEFSQLQETILANGAVRVANDLTHDDTFTAISTCLHHIYLHSASLVKKEAVINSVSRNLTVNSKINFSGNATRNSRMLGGGRVRR